MKETHRVPSLELTVLPQGMPNEEQILYDIQVAQQQSPPNSPAPFPNPASCTQQSSSTSYSLDLYWIVQPYLNPLYLSLMIQPYPQHTESLPSCLALLPTLVLQWWSYCSSAWWSSPNFHLLNSTWVSALCPTFQQNWALNCGGNTSSFLPTVVSSLMFTLPQWPSYSVFLKFYHLCEIFLDQNFFFHLLCPQLFSFVFLRVLSTF